MDLSSGGSGYVLYLNMISFFAFVFFLLTLGATPVFYKLWDTYSLARQGNFPDLPVYSPKALLSIDIFSFAAIYSYVSFDPNTYLAGYDSVVEHKQVGSWLYIFIGSNALNILIFFLAVVYWVNRSDSIIEEVDDATVTPSDFTLEVYNIPAVAKVDEVKEILTRLAPVDINPENIHIAKKFDDRIHIFKKFLDAAKVFKDIRTVEYRKLKKNFPELDHEQLMTKVMAEDYDGGSGYKSAFEAFKAACVECDKVEEADSDGYNIDDFDNVYAYVTFNHEATTFELMEQQRLARQFRVCKDCCCYPYPENLQYEWEGETHRLRLALSSSEPGDINWENIGLSNCELFLRNTCFVSIVLLVSGISFVLIYMGQNYASTRGVPVLGCASMMNLYVVANTGTTDINGDFAKVSDITMDGYQYYVDGNCASNSNCTQFQNYYALTTDTTNYQYLPYCICEPYINEPNNYPTYANLCDSYWAKTQVYSYIFIGITILTLVMNNVLLYTILYTVWITRPVSKTEEEAKKTVWVFITTFINMSIIPVLCYSTREIDYAWYSTVGLSVLGNFFLYAITPNLSGLISPMIKLCVAKSQGYFLAVDQEDYNNAMAGPDLMMYVYQRYSEFLTFMACCFIFGSSFPILYPIGCIGLVLMYFVEKYVLINVYRKVDFSSKLNTYSNNLYMWILIGHTLWILWIYSNPFFFISDSEVAARYPTNSELNAFADSRATTWLDLMQKFVIYTQTSEDYNYKYVPFWILLVVLLATRFFWEAIKNILYFIFCCCLCDEQDFETVIMDEEAMVYSPDLMETVVKSYDITDNPYYKRLLASIQADDDFNASIKQEFESEKRDVKFD